MSKSSRKDDEKARHTPNAAAQKREKKLGKELEEEYAVEQVGRLIFSIVNRL
jgi:hypothetical protein